MTPAEALAAVLARLGQIGATAAYSDVELVAAAEAWLATPALVPDIIVGPVETVAEWCAATEQVTPFGAGPTTIWGRRP